MVKTRKTNRYIKKFSVRRIIKNKRMYGGEVKSIHNIGHLLEFINKYKQHIQHNTLVQIYYEPVVEIKGRSHYQYKTIDVARKLPDIYSITNQAWVNTYELNQCLDVQDEEERKFNLDENKKLRQDSYGRLLQFYNANINQYTAYLKEKKKYDDLIFTWGETKPIEVKYPTQRKPELQKEVGRFCIITIQLHTRLPNNVEEIQLSQITEDYNKITEDYNKISEPNETINTNTYLKIKNYLEIDPQHSLISFYISLH